MKKIEKTSLRVRVIVAAFAVATFAAVAIPEQSKEVRGYETSAQSVQNEVGKKNLLPTLLTLAGLLFVLVFVWRRAEKFEKTTRTDVPPDMVEQVFEAERYASTYGHVVNTWEHHQLSSFVEDEHWVGRCRRSGCTFRVLLFRTDRKVVQDESNSVMCPSQS